MPTPEFGSVGTHRSGSTLTPQFAVPSGVAAGDVIIIPMFIDGLATADTLPSGFAHVLGSPLVCDGPSGDHSHVIVWKRATGADAGTYDFTLSASNYSAGAAVRYTKAKQSGDPWLVTDSDVNTGTSATTPPVSIDTTGTPDCLLVWCGTCWGGGSWTPPSGFTERFDAGDGVNTVADMAFPTPGDSGSVVGTSTSTDRVTGWIGALLPEDSGAGSPAPIHPPFWFTLRMAAAQQYRGAGEAVDSRAQTGVCSVGVSGHATAVKSAPQAGLSSIGVSGQGVAAKSASQTGTSSVGISGHATAKKSAPQTGMSSVGVSGQATAKKSSAQAGMSSVGVSGQATATKSSAQTGACFVGLSGHGPSQGSRAQTGRCFIGVGGYATARKEMAQTGVVSVGLSGTATAKKVAAETGLVSVGLSGHSSVTKRGVGTGRAYVALSGQGTGSKHAAQTGSSFVCFSGHGEPSSGQSTADFFVFFM